MIAPKFGSLGEPHSHPHRHERMIHSHAHIPIYIIDMLISGTTPYGETEKRFVQRTTRFRRQGPFLVDKRNTGQMWSRIIRRFATVCLAFELLRQKDHD